MSCEQTRAFIAANDLAAPELQEHARTCEGCAELLRSERLRACLVETGFTAASEAAASDTASSFAALERQLTSERGVWSTLRELPTSTRAVVVLSAASAVVVGQILFRVRPDLSLYPLPRLLGLGIGAVALIVLGTRVATRPLWRPALSSGAQSGALAALLVVPAIIALFGGVYTGHPAGDVPSNADFMAGSMACARYGSLLGLVVLVALWAVDRASRPLLVRSAIAAGVAGLAANLALLLHCPSNSVSHLFVGHASVALAFVLLYPSVRAALKR